MTVQMTECGKAFQERTAATGNAWSPSVEQRVAGTISCDVATKRRCRRVMISNMHWMLLARYSGAVPCRQRYTSKHSLYSILSGTRNQRSCTSSEVIWSRRHSEMTRRAAALMTACSLLSCDNGRPVRTELQ